MLGLADSLADLRVADLYLACACSRGDERALAAFDRELGPVMNGIARAGLVPGVDISVTGYDDLEEAAIATPALTTVWNGQPEVGRRAARALLDRIDGVTDQSGSLDLIRPELHIRQSTAPVKERA